MVLPEVLSAYGECVHERLAELALFVGIGNEGDPVSNLANDFIQAIVELRQVTDIPLKPEGLKREDIPGMVTEAIAEAGSLYPVPRYMSRAELSEIVEGLVPV
jgi:alcohol dehydrogenase class IV